MLAFSCAAKNNARTVILRPTFNAETRAPFVTGHSEICRVFMRHSSLGGQLSVGPMIAIYTITRILVALVMGLFYFVSVYLMCWVSGKVS